MIETPQSRQPTRKQLMATLRTGWETVRWLRERGCDSHAGRLADKLAVIQERIDKGDHR